MRSFNFLSAARFAILVLPIAGIATAVQVGCAWKDEPAADAGSADPDTSPDASKTKLDGSVVGYGDYGYGNYGYGYGYGDYGYGYGYGCGDTMFGTYGYEPYDPYGYGYEYGTGGDYGYAYGGYGYGYGYGCQH